jgi:hypothetical protein
LISKSNQYVLPRVGKLLLIHWLTTLQLSINFPLPSGSDFSFNLDPLFAPINATESTYSVMSTKIEVVLRKQLSNRKWAGLEGTEPASRGQSASAPITAAAITSTSALDAPAQPSAPTPSPVTAPSYPTSSRSGVKDWDKLASSLTSKKKSTSKSQLKTSNPPDDGADADAGAESDGAESIDSDFGSGDPVDSFFKKLYAGADADTRRAMVKSYYESEGTALSTNWGEVGKGKVEPKPPSSSD